MSQDGTSDRAWDETRWVGLAWVVKSDPPQSGAGRLRIPNRRHMAPLHLIYTEFEDGILEPTQRLFDSHPWSGVEAAKRSKFERWLSEVSQHVRIRPPAFLIVSPEQCADFGLYDRPDQAIYMPRYSVTTLFFLFRQHWHAVTDDVLREEPENLMEAISMGAQAPQNQTDSMAWATSLYYHVNPTGFANAVMKGSILAVHPDDL